MNQNVAVLITQSPEIQFVMLAYQVVEVKVSVQGIQGPRGLQGDAGGGIMTWASTNW